MIDWHGNHTVTLDITSFFKHLETLQENPIKEFSSDSEGCDTLIVVAISPALLAFVESNYVCASHVLLYLPLLWTRRFLQGSRGETSQT